MRMTSLAAIMVIAASTAMAQGTTSPSTDTSPSTAPTTAPSTAPSTGATGTTTMQKQTASGQMQFYTRQTGEVRGSSLIGATVRNDQNESIGEINELILNKDGQVVAAVIGVGGFLGIGEREVAVDFKSLRVEQDPNASRGSITVKMAATKDSLKNAPAWSWGDRGAATGTSGSKPVAK